jgi:hypothetical protein
MKNKKAKVISAFPGCGKTHFFKNNKGKVVLGSDSSTFDKSDFPRNYIEHIKENLDSADIIMVSSHKDVREALVKNGIDFTLVYPNIELKDQFVERYIERGSPESFVELLGNNWDVWVSETMNQEGCDRVELKSGEYLSDVI